MTCEPETNAEEKNPPGTKPKRRVVRRSKDINPVACDIDDPWGSIFHFERGVVILPNRDDSEDDFAGLSVEGSLTIETLLAVFDRMNDGVTIVSAEGKILHQNKAQAIIQGFDGEKIIGKSIWDMHGGDHAEEERAVWEETKNGGTTRIIQRTQPDGSDIWISLKTAPILDANGDVIFYLGIARDVTEFEKGITDLQGEIVNLEKNLEKEMVELSKRFDQMKVLQELGRRMVASIEEEEIAGDAATVLVETMGYDAAGIVLLSEARGRKTFKLIGSHAKIAPGKYGRKISEKQVLKALKDKSPKIEKYQTGRLSVGIMARSELIIPLIQSDNAIGAIIVADQEEDGFKEEDVSLIGTVADLVALSLSNCFGTKQMQDRELALNLLDDITLQTISTRDISDIMKKSAARIDKILDAQACLIGMLTENEKIDWISIDGAEEFRNELEGTKFQDMVKSKMVEGGEVFYTNDFLSEQTAIVHEGMTLLVNNLLICPIQLHDENIGVIVLINRMTPSGFGDSNAALVRNFSDHLSVLIQNARTMSSLDYSLRTRNLLLRTTIDLQGAAGASDIYQKLADMLLQVVPYESARFYSFGEKGATAVLSKNLGEKLNIALFDDNILDIVVKVLSERKSIISILRDESSTQRNSISLLVLPLLGREDEIGAIAIARTAEEEFNEQELEIATLFANHAAIALENTNLMMKEMDMLDQSIQKIKQLSSILDLTGSIMSVERQEDAVKKVLWAMTTVLGFEKGVMIIDPERGGNYVCLHTTGFAQTESERLICMTIPADSIMCMIDGQGKLVGKRTIFLGGTASRSENATEDTGRLLEDLGLDLHSDKFAITIEDSKGDMIGMILLAGASEKLRKSKEMIDLLEIYGNLASISINNARLFDKEIAARAEIETLNDLMTHDINNFIQGVLGYLDIINGDLNLGEKQREYATRAIHQVENTKRLIENVRKLAWIKAETAPKLQTVDLGKVIGEAVENVRANFPSKEINFISSIDKEDYYAIGDEMMAELFINLFSNCVKFTATNDVPIELDISSKAEFGKEYWNIEVRDHGRGIPDERKPFVFERFDRQDYTPYGFGLGLSIVRGLTRKYGGRVWVENRVPDDFRKGSKFILLIPRGEKAPAKPDDDALEAKRKLVRKVKERRAKGSSFSRVLKQPRQDRSEDEKAS